MDEIEEIFSSDNHLYSRIDIDTYSVSGCGSQLDGSTLNLRNNLYSFLFKFNVNSFFDAPCGDFWWMRYIDFKDIKYTGGDIITKQIEKLNNQFPDKKFIRFDVLIDKFPDVDLLFCRDCLFHFSNKHKYKMLNNFVNSNINYIMLSNHPLSINNEEISTGDFGHINWQLPPWNFNKPVDILFDSNYGYDTKEMQLYTREQIRNYIDSVKI